MRGVTAGERAGTRAGNERASRSAYRVLLADDDPAIRAVVGELLTLEGYRCSFAEDGEAALRIATDDPPDLILLDLMMPRVSGTEVLTRLRSDRRTRCVPIVLITGRSSVSERVEHLLAGADDYLTKPFDFEELLARVRVGLRRAELLRGANPISGLPGNAVISEEIAERLRSHRPFACLYVDIDHFKSFNDHYGFARGDGVIRALAGIVADVADGAPSPQNFVGHIGGDDLVVLTDQELAEPMAKAIADRFDAEAPLLYDPADRARGCLELETREGGVRRVPLVSVSIGIVLASARTRRSPEELAMVAAEMKEVAKRALGSSWSIDRRREPKAARRAGAA